VAFTTPFEAHQDAAEPSSVAPLQSSSTLLQISGLDALATQLDAAQVVPTDAQAPTPHVFVTENCDSQPLVPTPSQSP
jgi:hypothetical protein